MSVKPSPMHDDLLKAGYTHQATHEFNGNAKHVYHGTGGYTPVMKAHGFRKLTDTVWKHQNNDDSVQLAATNKGHKLTHHHNDETYKYQQNEGDQAMAPNNDLERQILEGMANEP